MKITEALKTIDQGWVRKYGGFRVRYQRIEGGQLVTGHSPVLEESPLDSEVSARRLAWKLWKATEGGDEDELVNLVVVDENDDPVPSYVTGEVEVFNRREG